jgi:hypothetical protein
LAEEASVDALIADIAAVGAERGEAVALVIIDTLARCASIDENSSHGMGQVVAACDRIRRETNASVLITHHTGKDPSNGARGSSALRAAVDSEIEVYAKDGARGLWVTKQRNGRAQFGWQFTLQATEILRDDETGRVEHACTIDHHERSDVRANFGAGRRKRKGLGKNQQKLRGALEQAYMAGDDCWDSEGLRRLAGTTFPNAARSTIPSAIEGQTTHDVLTLSDGKHYLAKTAGAFAQHRHEGSNSRPTGRGSVMPERTYVQPSL